MKFGVRSDPPIAAITHPRLTQEPELSTPSTGTVVGRMVLVNTWTRPVLDELRYATRDVHERLHRHAGFAALQDETIDQASYRALLARLYGFYATFEISARISPNRTGWLGSDLSALGMTEDQVTKLPRCGHIPAFVHSEEIMGSLYVVEGSAFGGRALAPHLDRLLGAGIIEGRRYLVGYGSETGAIWRALVASLEILPNDPIAHARCLSGAIGTFEAFELWLNGWEDPRR